MRYLRPLDGIRGLAVLAVVGLHARLPGMQGGGLGVDVFFALSGYLITSLLLREIDATGRINRRRFYARRALRLLPALAVAIAWTAILDATVRHGGGHIGEAAPAAAFYYANWLVAHNSQALGFLGQTWSLAIEEQFYLLWPVLLLAPAVRRNLRWSLPAFIALTIAWRIAAFHFGVHSVMLWSPARADELALGAWLAVRQLDPRPLPRWLTNPEAAVLAIGVLVAILVVSDRLPPWADVVGVVDLIAAATVVVIAHCSTATSPITAALSWTPLVGIGRVSYGLYLFHYAILSFLFAQGYSHTTVLALGLPLMTVLTLASWFLVERPAQRLKVRFVSNPVPHSEPALIPVAAPDPG